jgi:hypothetical protein
MAVSLRSLAPAGEARDRLFGFDQPKAVNCLQATAPQRRCGARLAYARQVKRRPYPRRSNAPHIDMSWNQAWSGTNQIRPRAHLPHRQLNANPRLAEWARLSSPDPPPSPASPWSIRVLGLKPPLATPPGQKPSPAAGSFFFGAAIDAPKIFSMTPASTRPSIA